MYRPALQTTLASLITLNLLSCAPAPEGESAGLTDAAEREANSVTPESDWVTVYDPSRAWNGYTLAFHSQRTPVIMDMNGRVVHSWPEARIKSRARLLEDGSLLGIALGRGVVEYDWDGNEVWRYTADNGFAHHDVIRLANGNTVTLIRPDDEPFDEVLEVDRDGEVVWRWQSGDSLKPFVPQEMWGNKDLTHMNSVQELPANRWYDQGDERFRPGNLLISARELDRVFVIDKQTREVTWSFNTGLQKQHESLMVETGFPGDGHILLFNNRTRSFYEDRQSTIEEIDPIQNRTLWQYRSAGFHSPTSGVQQPLPNGNILITSTRGGRTFEITRAGRLVWQWAPPFDPMRSHRYSYSHCPQLVELDRPVENRVEPADGYRHIDRDVYRFAGRALLQQIEIDGKNRKGILKHSNDCRQMTLPQAAMVYLEYGVDRKGALEAGWDDYMAEFRLTLHRVGSEEKTEVFSDRIELDEQVWRQREVDLSSFALQNVAFCIATQQNGIPDSAKPGEYAFWRRPAIRTDRDTEASRTEDDTSTDDLTPEELENRKRHLEALGYIN